MKISITVAAVILGCACASPRRTLVSKRSLQASMPTQTQNVTINVIGLESSSGASTNDDPIESFDLADKDLVDTENPETASSDDPVGSDDPTGTSEDSQDLTSDDPNDVSSEDTNATSTRSVGPTGTSEDSDDVTSEDTGYESSEDIDDATNDDPDGSDDPAETSEDSYDLTGGNQTVTNLVRASSKYKASTTVSAKAISPANKAIFSGVASAAALVGAITLF
eukprot:CCRYP_000753-RA/>CCRYP_000753-RA protein AED:0.31 eAED:0.31 QI:54/1/1/1/0/0/2/526/222